MIARFLHESVALEKDVKKLQDILKGFHNSLAMLRIQHLELSDGKPILWFLKKNGNETVLCFPFTHEYTLRSMHRVGDYIGVYATYEHGNYEATERCFGYGTDGEDEEKKKSSDIVRKIIRKLSTLPDWKSMSDEMIRVKHILELSEE